MKRFAAGLALFALGAAASSADLGAQERRGGPPGGGHPQAYANPSAAIAAEIAFARLAQEKGQWTAFRATAASDAVMFAPAMVLVQSWLKDKPDPAVPLAWQAHRVWSSCDGSLMVTTGAWQRGVGLGQGQQGQGRHGWFTTVWQRQEKGGYKWVFDHGDASPEAIPEPEMIAARVAECPERRAGPRGSASRPRGKPAKPAKAPPVPFDPARREGRSNDGTLTWQVTADAAGTHDFTLRMQLDGQMQDVRSEHVSGG